MPTCKIQICPKDQTEPAFPELTKENMIQPFAELYGVSILQHGMVSGRTSLGIVLKTADGKFVLAETSAAIFSSICHALLGAEQRFAESDKFIK